MLPVNPLRVRLARGEVAIGLGVRLARVAEVATLASSCQFDWLFLDLEHSPMSAETAAAISVAALGAGLAPLVRVPPGDFGVAARLLDAGAWGIFVPHIDTAEQAAAAVHALSFPPLGARSVSYSLPQLAFAPMHGGEAARHFNRQAMLVPMIESAQGVANAVAIAAVPGVDALFVGANDLSADLGVPGEVGHERVNAMCHQVVQACLAQGKWPGLGGVYAEGPLRGHVAQGMRLVLGATDMALMLDAARDRSAMLQRCRAAAVPTGA